MAIDARRQPALTRQIRTLFGAGTASGLSDGDLLGRFVARAGESSELAFAAILERHGGMVWGTCRRVLDDPRDAEDAFQATFLILVRRARSIRNGDSLASWLHGVAYRVACSAREDALRRTRHERTYAERAERLVPPPRDEGLDLKPIVDGELLRLPECYRAVVVLCDMEGLSYEQAARALGWPMGTIKSRLARGREKLRSRLIRRGVAPLAGLIGAGVPAELLRSTAEAASRIAARPIVAGAFSAQVIQLTEGVIRTMFLSKLKLSVAALVIGGGLVSLTGTLAGSGLGGRVGAQESPAKQGEAVKPEAPATSPERAGPGMPPDAGEAPPVVRSIPKPWETVVGVHVTAEDSASFGYGTVIWSTPEEALVLTTAHIFHIDHPHPLPPGKSPWKVEVDLFDGKLRGGGPTRIGIAGKTGGEVIDFDFSGGLGLVRIRPGRRLPASLIVPRGWEARTGMTMLALGCSEGQDATAWHTKVTGSVPQERAGKPPSEAIRCETDWEQGKAVRGRFTVGGGLFTTDGNLAGVCLLAVPHGDEGLYASPSDLYSFLDRNGLGHLHSRHDVASNSSPPVPAGGTPKETESSPPGGGKKAREDELTRQNARLQDEVQQLRDQLNWLRAANARLQHLGQLLPQGMPAKSEIPFAAPSETRRTKNPIRPPAPKAPHSDTRVPGTDVEAKSYLRHAGLIFAASLAGDRVIAYDPSTRWTAAIDLKASREKPLKVGFVTNEFAPGPVALRLSGAEIRRIAAFDPKSRTWHTHDLAEPVNGLAIPSCGDDTIAYDLGRHLYTYNSKSTRWDHLDLDSISGIGRPGKE